MRAFMNRYFAALGLALMAACSGQAQTPVVPAGSGTSTNPYQISQPGHLVWMGDNAGSSSGKYYTVQNDIDASGTAGWNGGNGFSPIGNPETNFLGILDGNGKTIRGLTINRPASQHMGLVGCLGSGGVVKNLGLTGGSVTGSYYVGSIAALSSGTVTGCFSTCSVAGVSSVGGLLGENEYGVVSACYATGPATASGSYAGGLVGVNRGTVNGSFATGRVEGEDYVGGLVGAGWGGTVSVCYATGIVTGETYDVGGLVGYNGGTIRNCHATGLTIGINYVGGLVGDSYNGTVNECYATGTVRGGDRSGGLIGANNSGTVSNSYATGAVSGIAYVGGLVGRNNIGIVGRCHSAGPVTGLGDVGGLVGYNSDTVDSSYWDTNTSGRATSAGGTGRTTAEMKQNATFVDWDFTNVWQVTEDTTYPFFGVEAVIPDGTGTAIDPHRISQLGHLVWMGDNAGSSRGKYYSLQNDMDASVTVGWEGGNGFKPIGTTSDLFSGVLMGNGKVIHNLTVNRPSSDFVGLFGVVDYSGMVTNLGLAGVAFSGRYEVGGLVGYNYGKVGQCYATGRAAGSMNYVGGLLGVNEGTVSRSYASVAVTGSDSVGGLVGGNWGGVVINCYATGSATGNNKVGGLVGELNFGTVSNGYATGSVSAPTAAGGLVGGHLNSGTIIASYWDTNATSQAVSDGGVGHTTAEMKLQATFVDWDFTKVWQIVDNVTYPLLQTESVRPRGLPWLHLLLGQ